MTYKTWIIPKTILHQTTTILQSGKHEIFAIWTGPLKDDSEECVIQKVIKPKQRAGFVGRGAYVHIEGTELSRIQFDNFDHQERSVVQLHTHPSADVRMSELDLQWEVVKHVGALSIIVPSYCKDGMDGFHGINVYEREVTGWRLWLNDEVTKRMRVI